MYVRVSVCLCVVAGVHTWICAFIECKNTKISAYAAPKIAAVFIGF